jgi:spore maturation protein CgeB
MRILFAGPGFRWSTTEARRRALIALGHHVDAIDVQTFVDPSSRLLPKIMRHLNIGRGVADYNDALVAKALAIRPNLIWLDQPVQVWRRTVLKLQSVGAVVVNRNSEYIGHRSYWFRHLVRAASLYDAHIVTNRLTADLLRRRGAKRIILAQFAYDPSLHRPVTLTPSEEAEYDTDAVFVGHWEPRTEGRVVHLRRSGIRVSVHGPNWHRAVRLGDRRRMAPLFGEPYVKALRGAKICLGFLSRWNHNQATPRTFEIPASGSFLLGDRTALQLSYFEEGREAEFFASDEEMVMKCRYYLQHEEERKTVAYAGYMRCLASAHSNEDEMRRNLAEIFNSDRDV